MRDKNVRAVDLSKATGISKSLISNYLKAKVQPKANNLQLIANALNVNSGMFVRDAETITYPQKIDLCFCPCCGTNLKGLVSAV